MAELRVPLMCAEAADRHMKQAGGQTDGEADRWMGRGRGAASVCQASRDTD